VGALVSECLVLPLNYGDEPRYSMKKYEFCKWVCEGRDFDYDVAIFNSLSKYMEKIEKSVVEHKEIKKMSNKKEKSLEALSLYQIDRIE